MLCSRLLRHDPDHGPIFRAFERGFRKIESLYSYYLDLSLRHRWVTIGLAIGIFILGLSLFPFLKTGFVTEPDESRFVVRFELPTGTSVEESARRLQDVEKAILSQDEVRSAFAATGFSGGPNSGIVFANLVYASERNTSQSAVMSRLRTLLKEKIPEARISVENVSAVGGGQRNADLQFVVQGPEVDQLEQVASAMLAEMRKLPGFVDVDDNLRLNKPELKVEINRNLADDLGVDVRTITQNFNILFGGLDVAKFKESGKRYDIRARALPEARSKPSDLLDVALRSSSGELTYSPNLVHVIQGVGPQAINRYNRSRAVTLYANLDGASLGDALDEMRALAEKYVPDDPAWGTALTGSADVFAESFRYLLNAVLISLLVIYVILGSQFESFIHPFTILMSVPLAVAGSFGLILITGVQLDIFAFIGFVMLIGIVTKNAILLVDFTNQIRTRGVSRDDALRQAGPLRLRPILMTAFTTIAAVTPVALALSEGGEQRAPMGVSVIGGMLTSTLLTLIVIPSVYTIMDDIALWGAAKWRNRGLGSEPGESISGEAS